MSATQARGVGPRRCCTYVLKVYCAAHGNFGTQDEQRCFKPGTSLGSISRAHMHLASALPRAERRPGVGQGVFMERVSGGQYEGDRAAGLSPGSSAATVSAELSRDCDAGMSARADACLHIHTRHPSYPRIDVDISQYTARAQSRLPWAFRATAGLRCGAVNGNYVSPSPRVHLRNALDKLYRSRRWRHVYVSRVAAAACAARARGMPRSPRTGVRARQNLRRIEKQTWAGTSAGSSSLPAAASHQNKRSLSLHACVHRDTVTAFFARDS